VRQLLAAAACTLCVVTSFAAEPVPEDTPKAAAARRVLKTKVSFTWKSTSFGDVIAEIKDTPNIKLGIRPDTKAGINLNKPITYSCKDKPLEEVFDEVLGKNGWGYFIKSQKGDGYDGVLHIRPGKERGWEGREGKPDEKKDK
jgi:hypothetical protein